MASKSPAPQYKHPNNPSHVPHKSKNTPPRGTTASPSIPIPVSKTANSTSSHDTIVTSNSSKSKNPIHPSGVGSLPYGGAHPRFASSHDVPSKGMKSGASPIEVSVGDRGATAAKSNYKRNLSVAQLAPTMTTEPAMSLCPLKPLVGDPEPHFECLLDDYANSQRVQNAW